ncbi:MAG: RNA polymerase factor sigma-54 [Alphaproteobacteria bacterium]|nr:RNA polymerase factor sigma-54 [Alphaproteobacteria bacterium]
MRIGPSLIVAPRQALAMTPQLQQAIKLLQFSQLELAAYLQQELEKNPLLTEASVDLDEGPEAPPEAEPVDTAQALRDATPALAEADERWTREHADRGGDALASTVRRDPDAPDALDFLADKPLSLEAHVARQIGLTIQEPAARRIADALARELDDAGYCRVDVARVAAALGVTVEAVEAVRGRLRAIEPAGLFARDLGECLAAQLAERNRLDPAMQALLANLALVASGDLVGLRKRCGVDAADLADMLAELRALDPRPGLAFDTEAPPTAAPDIVLSEVRDPDTGERGWHLELTTEALPRVLVDRHYHATLMKGARSRPDRDFVAERFQSANWLVKTLEQRATTILKVAREIVRQQDAFFREGVGKLRPLVLRDIAIATELHESTVSRVTSNKYIATPSGTFELKYFFTSALAGAQPGATVSSEAVRQRIRLLIEGEGAVRPLSDDRLVALLKGEGIEIARRTVAKYREALRIPSSAERRRLGRVGLRRGPAAAAIPPAQAALALHGTVA